MAGALYKRRERSLDRLERSPSFPGMMMNPIMPFVVCVFLSRGAQKPLSFLSLSLEQQQREKKVESNTLETKSSSSLSLSFLQTTDVITERIIIIIIVIRRKCRHRFRTLHRPLPCRTRRPRTRQGHLRPLRFYARAERDEGIAVRGDERDGLSRRRRDGPRRRLDRHLGTTRRRERTDAHRRRVVRAQTRRRRRALMRRPKTPPVRRGKEKSPPLCV